MTSSSRFRPTARPRYFEDAKRFFAKEHVCLPLVGVFIRFARVEDEAWLAHTSASSAFEEDEYSVFFEMPIYVPQGVEPATLAQTMDPYRRWIERLVQVHGARPHSGQNDEWVFDLRQPCASLR